MRIALITPHATPPGLAGMPGGGPRVVPLARALAELGHDVTVYARRDAPALPATVMVSPNVTIEHVPAGPAERLRTDDVACHAGEFGAQLARRWQQAPPDVAHAYSWPSGLASLTAARDLGVPVVQTFNSLTSQASSGLRESRESLARIRLKVCLARSVSAVLVRSTEEMTELARLGVPRASMRVVPWGVDTTYFAPEGPAAPRNGCPRLVAVGPLTEQRRLEVIVRALAAVPGAELLLAGAPLAGQRGRDTADRALSRLAGKLRVADRVSFAGKTGWEDLPALLRSADVFVSAAWDDPLFDAAALQAMACGTPVAAPAVGFYADAVIDGTTGMLVPPGRPAVLARRLRRLLSSPLQLDAFGIAAADRARSRYSWDRIARETAKAYERFLPCPVPEPEPEPEPADEADLELAEAFA